ncbi:HEAT repeat domain-containing protein [Streptomyces sp. NPDC002039]|uniref:HEAT repeat domain-containing protein n=1 Tax=Streptomyces sp. NPDC002039 TaxID=3154660 RepID=UPI00332FC838
MTAERTTDRQTWCQMGAEHALFRRPTLIAPPLVVPSPHLLNTHDLDWESVEYLIAWLVRKVEGWEETWIYGERGQNQHGIDVAGVTGTEVAVFQAKRLKKFTCEDLERAVDRFVTGKRPLGATRFIVVTTHDASRTEIQDRLMELRQRHPDLQLELWNRKRLSDELRPHPEIVTAFFGAATTQVFCPPPTPEEPAPAVLEGQQVDAEALLRGPVAHLGLSEYLAEGDQAREDEPGRAAEVYAYIAEQLEQTLYAPFASWMRARQAAALHDAGEHDAALRVDLQNMARDLSDGLAFEARRTIAALSEQQVEGDDALIRSINTLGCLAEYEFEHTVSLDDVAGYLDVQSPDDPSVQLAAALFTEHAMAARRPDLLTKRLGLLEAIIVAGTAGHLDTARLRASLADADPSGSTWRKLHRAARHDYRMAVRALLAARRARFLVIGGDAEGAVDGYYDAIEHSLAAGTHGDAEEWLAAQRLVISRHATSSQDYLKAIDAHTFQRVLRQAGGNSIMPVASNHRDPAMATLLRGKHQDARQDQLQYRRRAFALGSWAHEREAEELLARLYTAVGETVQAMNHLINSGIANAAKQVRTFFPALPPEALAWAPPADLRDRPVWERTGAFALAGRMADILTDSTAEVWIEEAIREVENPTPRTRAVTPPTESAWGIIRALAVLTTPEQARRAAVSPGVIERTTADTARARIRALAALAGVHEILGPGSAQDLARAALTSDYLLDEVIRHAQDLFIKHASVISKECTAAAMDGKVGAVRLLLLADTEPGICRQAVADWLQQGGAGDSNLSRTDLIAIGARLLPVEEIAPRIESLAEQITAPQNRDDQCAAITALGYAAEVLPLQQRRPYAELALAAARGELPVPAEENLPDHPLDRFRFLMSPPMIRPQALVTAARLGASSKATASAIAVIALKQLSHATDGEARLIARALGHLDPAHLPPLTTLAVHQQAWARCFAARSRQGDEATLELCRELLAGDTDWRVRVNIAQSLPCNHPLLVQLQQDHHRQVRTAATKMDGAV